MKQTIFVLGGCRSGKSGHALELASGLDAKQRYFIATCQPHDAEMVDRVARHKAERSAVWETLEVPVEVPAAIRTHARKGNVILVDCLTLWVTNLMMENDEPAFVEQAAQRLTLALASAQCPVILVSNEVGMGIVPDNALARRFRDMVGWVNQQVAAAADRVVLTVAGIPMTVKPGVEP